MHEGPISRFLIASPHATTHVSRFASESNFQESHALPAQNHPADNFARTLKPLIVPPRRTENTGILTP